MQFLLHKRFGGFTQKKKKQHKNAALMNATCLTSWSSRGLLKERSDTESQEPSVSSDSSKQDSPCSGPPTHTHTHRASAWSIQHRQLKNKLKTPIQHHETDSDRVWISAHQASRTVVFPAKQLGLTRIELDKQLETGKVQKRKRWQCTESCGETSQSSG